MEKSAILASYKYVEYVGCTFLSLHSNALSVDDVEEHVERPQHTILFVT